MLPITSLQNPTIKLIRSLTEKKARREHKLFVAEGLAMMERAIAEGWTPKHVIATKPLSLWEDVKSIIVSPDVMAALSAQNNPHDVLATFTPRFDNSLQAIDAGTVLALEEIRDPGNLGTILRTADAAGTAGVMLVGDCCDPHSLECVRASTGSIFATRLFATPTADFVALCETWPGDVVGTAMTAKDDYRSLYNQPALIVLGSESRGLSRAVSAVCTRLVRIPMRKSVESLNVATAAALMMYAVATPA
jgi:RNA methyltransferase, TrmH family